MKKFPFLLAIALLSACNERPADSGQTNNLSYTTSPADVVDKHGEIENLERLEEFIENTQNGNKDELLVVRYTTEGSPILHKLQFDGVVIASTLDTSIDAYGQGEIYNYTCKAIGVVERVEGKEYLLEDCDQPVDTTILVDWNE